MIGRTTLGPLRRFGPLAGSDFGEGDFIAADEWYSNWLQEVDAHLYYPWAADYRFNSGVEITLAASASGSEVVGFPLPPTHIGVWYTWSQSTGVPGDYANITWRLALNGVNLPDHSSIVGQVSSMLNPEWLYTPIPQGSRVSVMADNGTAVAITTVGARIRGWHWPMKGKREGRG